jgi:hypothetical protein
MPIRRVGESLWKICKERAKDKYGLLYEEEKVDFICADYADREQNAGLLTKKTIDRNDLVSFLKKAVDEEEVDNHKFIPDSIEIVRENVYFIPSVFKSTDVMDNVLIPSIRDLFSNNFVVSSQMIVQKMGVPHSDQEFFVKLLSDNHLVESLSASDSIDDAYVIGPSILDRLKNDESAGQFKGMLSQFTNNGIISRADLTILTGISFTEKIIDYFERINILCRLDQKASQYFIYSMLEEFIHSFMLEINDQLQRYIKEHDYAITRQDMKVFCLDKLEKLYGLKNTDLSDNIMTKIMEKAPRYLEMETAGELNEILYDAEKIDQIAEKTTQRIDSNMPQEVVNSLKSAGNGREKLSTYIEKVVFSERFNENRIVDKFIKERIVEHSKEIIIEGYFPKVKNGE